jgi:hypothetical protein
MLYIRQINFSKVSKYTNKFLSPSYTNQFQTNTGNFQYNQPASQGYVQYTNQNFPGNFVVMQGNAPNSFPNNQQMSATSQNIQVQRSDRRNKCIIILDTILRILTIVSLDF